MEDPALVPRLRWATLGYHHDWDTKVYSEENASPFPVELAALTGGIAAGAGFPSFLAEAAIVNFYPMDASLGSFTVLTRICSIQLLLAIDLKMVTSSVCYHNNIHM